MSLLTHIYVFTFVCVYVCIQRRKDRLLFINILITMRANTTIAILGATGNMGSAIAKSLAKSGHRILLMSANEAKLNALSESIKNICPNADIDSIDCAYEASWEADIIIAAVPYTAEKEVADKIKEVATGKIVISIANPLNQTYDGLITAPGTSAAEELQRLLPHAKVVKAFNTTFANVFAEPVIDEKIIDCFIAGDDDKAVKVVAGLVIDAGFNPVVAGKLAISRALEAMQMMLINISNREHYNGHAGFKIVHG
jgi:8-hydroxy-5-deazaflavin:NADPH oxidoreductase